MYKHEVGGLAERITITYGTLSARVTVTLDDAGPRPGYRVSVATDHGMTHEPAAPGGEWDTLACGQASSGFKVVYTANYGGNLPALVLDAPREWRMTWDVLVPHPHLAAARLERMERQRRERLSRAPGR